MNSVDLRKKQSMNLSFILMMTGFTLNKSTW